MGTDRLVLFDYSGTLCFDSIRFGSPDSLMAELVSSGLAGIGVPDPEFFWRKLVNPTWVEGSTTSIGYAALMARRLKELLPERDEKDLRRAVERFTRRYFGSFSIDGHWKEPLRRLHDTPSLSLMVVTDHYADATAAIVRSLAEIGIEARGLDKAGGTGGDRTLAVINSADLGFSKADSRFWETIISSFPDSVDIPLLLVDDFGFNEAGGSDYGTWQRVLKRRKETVGLLERLFTGHLRVVSFFVRDVHRSKDCAGEGRDRLHLMGDLVRTVEDALTDP